MDGHFTPRCPPPRGLVVPVPVDPNGHAGPTRGQAQGPSWRRVGPAGYVPSTVARTVEQRILEEWRNLPGSVVTGWAACRLWGAAYCDGLAPDGSERPVPLLVPKDRSVRPRPGRVGEYDGAAHRTSRRHARDVARESALRDLGLEVVRVVAGGLTTAHGRAAAATLIRRGAARARTTAPGSWRLVGTGPRWQSAADELRAALAPRCGT